MSKQQSSTEPVAGDIMSAPGIACEEEAGLEEVAELLADREISGVPVVNEAGEVTGVISERDIAHGLGAPLIRLIIRRPVQTGSFLRTPDPIRNETRRAKDIMTTPAIVASPRTPLHRLASIMVTERINRIPIVRSHRLVGVVTRGDVLGAIGGISRRRAELDEPPFILGANAHRAAQASE